MELPESDFFRFVSLCSIFVCVFVSIVFLFFLFFFLHASNIACMVGRVEHSWRNWVLMLFVCLIIIFFLTHIHPLFFFPRE